MAVDLSKTHMLEGDNWVMQPNVAVQYRASLASQLEDWLKGIDRHTANLPAGVEEECTPDMACCCPTAAWPMDMRQQFVEASEEDRHRMMFAGLGNVLAAKLPPDAPAVYLAGGDPETVAKH